jgi:Na+/H+ antiporter NhaC
MNSRNRPTATVTRCVATQLLASLTILIGCGVASPLAVTAQEDAGETQPATFRIEAPAIALADVPVSSVRIEAVDVDGRRVETYNDVPRIEGLRITGGPDRAAGGTPPFDAGLLELRTDLSQGRKVYVTADTIAVSADGVSAARPVRLWPWWVSLVPPLVAIGLAVLLRNVLVSLFLGVWAGAALLLPGEMSAIHRVGGGFLEALTSVLVEQIADRDHLMVILFTMFLGAMVGVMSASGGTSALVHRLAGVAANRRRVQLTTWGLGLLIFFDDYANCLLLGSTMRPVTDRQRISREKLAFLVDATAAPVAGLAIVSTWIGIEVGLIGDTFSQLSAAYGDLRFETDAYATFLATLPYRFYPVLLIFYLPLIAWTGRDFGPMLRAERRAWQSPAASELTEPGTTAGAAGNCWNAVIPLAVLFALLMAGFWWTGLAGIADANTGRAARGAPLLANSLREIISHADSYRVLLVSSFVASAAAIVAALATGALSLHKAVDGWLDGLRSMLLGVTVLTLAWCISFVCGTAQLNTAGALVELTDGLFSVRWMPAIAFVLSSAVAFATGTSWATMSLLIPLTMSLTFGLLVDDPAFVAAGTVQPFHPVFLASIGAVLAGSIFGDHCSPISDTTVLSSAACECDHLAHVLTQLPYALVVGAVSLAVGYIPAGFGWPGLLLVPGGMAVLAIVHRLIARRVEESRAGPAPCGQP